MYKNVALITYYALTPVHMGTGSSLSYIDLPIQRERHTSFPMMAASGIKGVFRSFAKRSDMKDDDVNKIFGLGNDTKQASGSKNDTEKASKVVFTDARVLFYPVRSLKNIFAWITCPFVISRFKEDLKDIKNLNFPNIHLSDDGKVALPTNSGLKINQTNKVGLEEFIFNVKEDNSLQNFVEDLKSCLPKIETIISSLNDRLCVVSNNVFTDFVNYAVEVRTRIKIDQLTGTAQEGALFTVEMVPSESIFYSLLFTKDDDSKNYIKQLFKDETVLQFGGDETIGLGLMKVKVNFL